MHLGQTLSACSPRASTLTRTLVPEVEIMRVQVLDEHYFVNSENGHLVDITLTC